ncbi:queuine tRNA-ribosyltransferase [Methanobrevibacter woesei]|jgi:predicted RNA-binding protein|uniref:Queuine tRNA-ribosyltransferase n=1 Tax=Methanobrevibacter woesei TaxID=190976 RepID=A0A2U1S7E2_9EURY|nr:archaeosine tRNA-ribosyltransferase [Methanobrevibacter woesei]MCC9262318.1 archaeosine tRNA-ribosyltransferase [Methanobrevibacter woesei]PWB85992.1 queuine tRNA-ribosyltransferase [Methanobrevibacter woesei]
MNSKFEIKSHDGPGRIGKLEDIQTPCIFHEKSLKVAPSEGSAYNVDYEIAKWNVELTLKKAEEYKDSCNIATIQGSKYIDLRVECGKRLEELGYNGFLIANSDDLLLHPRDLVDLIVTLKKELKPTSYLIFTFAEPSFMPLLSYMGIDGFLSNSSEYYSYLNVLLTPTKTYELDTYPIYEDISREELEKYNLNTLKFVIKEIQTHMKNKSLRNLVEERSNTNPQNISALKILDKKYMDYLLEYTQLY